MKKNAVQKTATYFESNNENLDSSLISNGSEDEQN
jgi:hypothetical protein